MVIILPQELLSRRQYQRSTEGEYLEFTSSALIVIMAAIGTVSTMRMPTSESYITGNTPEHRRGTVLGLCFFAATEVSGLWTPVVGILIDNVGFRSTFYNY